MAIYARKNFAVLDFDNVTVIHGATITVRHEVPGKPLAALKGTRTGTGIGGTKSNPYVASDGADAGFFARGGAYEITATKDGFSRTWSYEPVGLSQESDGIFPDGANVEAYGAVSNDPSKAESNTAAFLAAWAASPNVFASLSGQFYVEQIVVPAGARSLKNANLIAGGVYDGAAPGQGYGVLNISNVDDLTIWGGSIEVDTGDYPETSGMKIFNCENVVVDRVAVSGGYYAIQHGLNENITIKNCVVSGFDQRGLEDAGGSTDVSILNNTVRAGSASSSHSINHGVGLGASSNVLIAENSIYDAKFWSIHTESTDTLVCDNRSFNSVKEAITIDGARTVVARNFLSFDDTHEDYGISGNFDDTEVIDNVIYRPFGPAITVNPESTGPGTIRGNLIVTAGADADSNWKAINLFAPDIIVADNVFRDPDGVMQYNVVGYGALSGMEFGENFGDVGTLGFHNPDGSGAGTGTKVGVTEHGNSDFTIPATYTVVRTTASLTAPRTWTLPAAKAFRAGTRLLVEDAAGGVTSANSITLARAGSDTVAGGTSFLLDVTRGAVQLVTNGVSAWTAERIGFVDVASGVRNVLGFGNGGTGAQSYTNHGVVIAGATGLGSLSVGATGTVLLGSTGADPAFGKIDTTHFATNIIDTDGALTANSDTRLATQKAVKTYADSLIAANDAMVFRGATDCSGNPNYPAANRGDTYRVSVAGRIGGASGVVVEVGDIFICNTDSTSSGNQATVGANWNVIQVNIDGAVTLTGTQTLTNKTIDSASNTLQVSGVTVSRGQYPGTNTNNNATAGNIGEVISSSAAGVALTTGVQANLTSISLTAGDWDVTFDAYYSGAAGTTIISVSSSISQTSATLDFSNGAWGTTFFGAAGITQNTQTVSTQVGPHRISLASTTTIYAVAFAQFGVSTESVGGRISARRVR